MSAKYFALLTDIGVAKITNAAALGIKLNITELAVGDGGGSLPTPTPGQTVLVNERRRAPINRLSIDPLNDAQIIVEQVIPENVGGWWIKEIGLYDEDGDLVAVSNCPETYKPLLQEGSGRTQIVRMVIIVSNTSSVTVKIDPAVVLATRSYVDDLDKNHRHDLANIDGSTLIGTPDCIEQLRLIMPTAGTRLKTKGALVANDSGGGWWVFESGNRTAKVSTMPNIWIAPMLFPDGSHGAWRPDFSEGIWVNKLGYGLTANTSLNDTILEQVINIYNTKGERVNLPAGVAAHHKMTWKFDPHLEGVSGAIAGLNSGTGTVMLFTDELTIDDCIALKPDTGRITGLTLKNITIIGKEIFIGGSPTTFKTRTNRVAISGNSIGGQIEVANCFIIGVKKAVHGNELWDGAIYGMRILYCGIESVVPAFCLGSDALDNSNNLHLYGLHIEFCPNSLYMGLCRNISFYGGKIETNRSEDATGYVVNLSIGVFEMSMHGTMFVQSTFNTKSPFMLNQGRGVKIGSSDFTSPNYSESFKYHGISWYHGNDVNQSENVLRDVRFDNVLSTDSVNGVDYPIFAGNNESGSIRVTVPSNAVGGGVVSLGANCSMAVNIVTNTSGAAKPGGTIHFRASGSSVELRRPAGTVLGTYATGDRNNVLTQNIPIKTAYNNATPDVTGHPVVYVGSTPGVNITGFTGMAGHTFSIRLGMGAATLINSGSLKLKGGNNIAMVANTLYTFTVIDSSNNCEQN